MYEYYRLQLFAIEKSKKKMLTGSTHTAVSTGRTRRLRANASERHGREFEFHQVRRFSNKSGHSTGTAANWIIYEKKIIHFPVN